MNLLIGPESVRLRDLLCSLNKDPAAPSRTAGSRLSPEAWESGYFIACCTTGQAVEFLFRSLSLPIRPPTVLTPARSNSPV